MTDLEPITLQTPLDLRTSFAFPLQSARARREVLIGAALLLVPLVGWLLNMGHRVMMVHRMLHGEPAWPSWRGYGELLRHGAVTFAGMLFYYAPGLALLAVAWTAGVPALAAAGALLLVLATLAIPGYMTHYCREFDAAEIFNPARALGRALQGGAAYWHAWSIALAALLLSFAGLLAFGIGFLVTSVWFWQVAGFSFARVFTQRYLAAPPVATASVGGTLLRHDA
ncbi:MAG TPA: DUF4013 domain-containing protein [Longimicrobium sp.]|nr:DUF4013 domain-containing protein [Longimicrobium sp.]